MYEGGRCTRLEGAACTLGVSECGCGCVEFRVQIFFLSDAEVPKDEGYRGLELLEAEVMSLGFHEAAVWV